MNFKQILVCGVVALMMLAAAQAVLAQEPEGDPATVQGPVDASQSTALKEEDLQWAWGEVVNLDPSVGTITLKYLDYETDQEKELQVVVDEKTTLENIKDLSELKIKDTLSIDYIAAADNRNLAKNISLEKTDETSTAVMPDEPVAAALPDEPAAGSSLEPADNAPAAPDQPA